MRRLVRSRAGSAERGFALIAVLMVLAFVAIIGAEFAYAMRLEATAARAYKDTLIAGHLAEAGMQQAIREIVADFAYVGLGDEKELEADKDCPLVFYGRDRLALKRLPHQEVPLGGGQFSYCITDEEARINLNTSPPDRFDRLLVALGVEKSDRDVLNDSLQDWRDADENHRLNGAESEDYYLKLSVPFRSKNGNLDTVGELLQIKGFTTQLMEGADGKPGLASLVTVKTQATVNINTAGREVLRALNISDAEFSEIEQTRRLGPYLNAGRFSGRGLAVTSRTFRIEAQGLIDGRVRARLTVVVQKRTDGSGDSMVVLEWSGIR
jgi:general secretion pathway protein K